MQTIIEKDYYGLNAVTEIPLNAKTEEGDMFLRVTSSKRKSGKSCTIATVIYRKDTQSFTTVIFQDYCKVIAQGKIARVTEKSLGEFHAKALEAIPTALEAVRVQYNLTA
jgi:ribosomal protein L15